MEFLYCRPMAGDDDQRIRACSYSRSGTELKHGRSVVIPEESQIKKQGHGACPNFGFGLTLSTRTAGAC
jgi:hypothetical protein